MGSRIHRSYSYRKNIPMLDNFSTAQPQTVLITGGAGFIGSHLAQALLQAGHTVRVLDVLDPQVHPQRVLPSHVPREAAFIQGDVRDHEALRTALQGVEVVFHLAALTSVTQSMYDLHKYMDVNVSGTAALLDVIVQQRLPVRKLILSSSRAVYGEGAYHCAGCAATVYPALRTPAQLAQGEWEPHCPHCGRPTVAVATPEHKPLSPLSVYAQSKWFQEELCTSVSQTYGLDLVILRYFNVYGPYQALSNPYTGIAPVFCTRILAGKTVSLYEDGQPLRDFVHVRDVVRANLLALLHQPQGPIRVNIGSGQPGSIEQICLAIFEYLGIAPRYAYTGQYRLGDIRSCYADLSYAQQVLGYRPSVSLRDGIAELLEWVLQQPGTVDRSDEALQHLAGKGLIHTSLAR